MIRAIHGKYHITVRPRTACGAACLKEATSKHKLIQQGVTPTGIEILAENNYIAQWEEKTLSR